MGVDSPDILQPAPSRPCRSIALLAGLVLVALVATFVPVSAVAAASAQDDEGDVEQDEGDQELEEEEELDEGGAVAEEEGEVEADQAIDGRLQYRDEDGVRQPVVGASLTIEAADFDFLETVVTDEDGVYRIGLAEPGTYVVSLDVATLPEGVELVELEQEASELDVAFGEERGVIIRLTAGFEAAADTTFDRALRLGVDGLRFGLILAMASVGLSLIFGTTGLVNFAHGEMVTFGALMAYLFNQTLGLHLLYAAVLAMIVAGIAGAGFNRAVWRPMRDRGVGVLGMVIASIGLGLFLRYVFLYQFRGPRRSYAEYSFQTEPIEIGPVDVLPRDLWIMVVSLFLLVGVGLALQWTRSGKAIRAVADDRDLAESSGVDVEQVISVVWISGAALAAVGGVFQALSQQVSWQMGEQLLLLMFAAVILGGLGTAYGALVGGLVIGLFFQLSALWVAPELRLGVALLVLILVLLVRPQGILGQAERVG